MGRLGCGVDYSGRGDFRDEAYHTFSISNVHLVVRKPRQTLLKTPLVPSRVTSGAKKYCPLIVVDPVNLPAQPVEMDAYLAANEPRRSGNQQPSLSHTTVPETELLAAAVDDDRSPMLRSISCQYPRRGIARSAHSRSCEKTNGFSDSMTLVSHCFNTFSSLVDSQRINSAP